MQPFVQSLNEVPWDTVFIFNDINDIYNAWFKILSGIIDEHVPTKYKRVNMQHQPVWFNNYLNGKIAERNHLLKRPKELTIPMTGQGTINPRTKLPK